MMEGSFWNFDKPYRTTGYIGGGGLGNGLPSAVGAALAHKKHGRICVNSQRDGEFMFCPQPLWTAAKYQIPFLTVMRNNRAYHEEVMVVQRWCNRMNRGIDRASIGNELGHPNIDYAKFAQSLGVYGEGPIENVNDLGPALKRALAVVKRGEPALVDVVTQPR
jgi:acetolactate synthase-1/2/3 large subunit